MAGKVFTSPKGKAYSVQTGWTEVTEKKQLSLFWAIIVNLFCSVLDWFYQFTLVVFLLFCVGVTIYVVVFYNYPIWSSKFLSYFFGG